jgi:hypothetical protein
MCPPTPPTPPTATTSTGLLAQEVEQVFPEVVTRIPISGGCQEEEGPCLAVNYGNMMGLVVQAINEMRERIERIEEKTDNTGLS